MVHEQAILVVGSELKLDAHSAARGRRSSHGYVWLQGCECDRYLGPQLEIKTVDSRFVHIIWLQDIKDTSDKFKQIFGSV